MVFLTLIASKLPRRQRHLLVAILNGVGFSDICIVNLRWLLFVPESSILLFASETTFWSFFIFNDCTWTILVWGILQAVWKLIKFGFWLRDSLCDLLQVGLLLIAIWWFLVNHQGHTFIKSWYVLALIHSILFLFFMDRFKLMIERVLIFQAFQQRIEHMVLIISSCSQFENVFYMPLAKRDLRFEFSVLLILHVSWMYLIDQIRRGRDWDIWIVLIV